LKHIVCYSGGHSSGLVAVEVVRKYGKNNVTLLNHDISASVENLDIKRFKQELADYLGLPITYANIKDISADNLPDQFDVVVEASAFKVGSGTELCTSRLKTEPFAKWLSINVKDKGDHTIHYGFDANEKVRIQRRSSILGQQGFITDYPLALWKDRTIFSTLEIGILPPNTYEMFKHANCIGCLKAGKQHWYIVYCTRKDIWEKAKWAENEIGYTIIKGTTLEELEPLFETMYKVGIVPTEHILPQTFWAGAKKTIRINVEVDSDSKPCECVF
jgi:3'-phosphoadenosine 5'-phosphosulfate sulfotransferase (PAPS reductase)/FAD synthetase